MRILVVDDSKENLYLLKTMLSKSRYKVITVENGLKALKKLKKDNIDIIISDILMPKIK